MNKSAWLEFKRTREWKRMEELGVVNAAKKSSHFQRQRQPTQGQAAPEEGSTTGRARAEEA